MGALGPNALAEALRTVSPLGVAATYEVLIANLAPEIEFRHVPPVADLDGFRTPAEAAHYLHTELVAFPRAFTDVGLTVTFAPAVADGTWVRVPEVHWAGTLHTTGQAVDVGMLLEMQVTDAGITLIGGAMLATTARDDIVAWLKAVEATGGFHPGRGRAVGTRHAAQA